MRKVVKDLEGEKITWRRNTSIPIEDRAIDNLDMINMPPRVSCPFQLRGLQCCQRWGNLNDLEFRPLIYIWMDITDEIQDIQHQCPISGAHLIYYQIMKRVMQKLVVRNQILRYSFPVVLGGCMP